MLVIEVLELVSVASQFHLPSVDDEKPFHSVLLLNFVMTPIYQTKISDTIYFVVFCLSPICHWKLMTL